MWNKAHPTTTDHTNYSKYSLENKLDASVNTITQNTRNLACTYAEHEAVFCF